MCKLIFPTGCSGGSRIEGEPLAVVSSGAVAARGRGVASMLIDYNATEPWPSVAPEAYVFGDGVAAATVAVKAWEMACGWTGEAAP